VAVVMTNESFIGQLLARVPRQGRWPGEDLLTEATAAVLRRAPELTSWLAARLTDGGSLPADIQVNTQARVVDSEKRKIDLELIGDELRLWIEVKDEAGESGHTQVSGYRDALDTKPEPRKELVYLSRLGAALPAGEHAKPVRWQSFGATLQQGLDEVDSDLAPDARWIVQDYLNYLKERGLADSNPVPSDLPEIAATFQSTRSALRRLAYALAEEVEARGWPLAAQRDPVSGGGKKPRFWPGQWWGVHEARPASYSACDFDWVLWGFGDHGSGDATPRFAAGLIWRSGRAGENPVENGDWLSRMLALDPPDGFGRFESPERYDGTRVYRSVPLERVTAETSVNDQARLLTDLVDGTYALLVEHAPPESPTPHGMDGP
jgi:hypothetical protein